jgi:hypothetical protein
LRNYLKVGWGLGLLVEIIIGNYFFHRLDFGKLPSRKAKQRMKDGKWNFTD